MEKRFEDALKELVKSGRCTAEELKQFSEKELLIFAKATAEYLEKGESLTIHEIEASDYEYKIPGIKQFIEDPYYLGKELGYPLGEDGKPLKGEKRQLYDFWMEKLIGIETEPCTEILVTGGIGLGKTTFMNVVALYDYIKLAALREPQRHYGLMPSTTIVFAFFNIFKTLALDVGYAQFQAIMDNSPFFKKIMGRNTHVKEGFQLHPPKHKHIAFRVGSRIGHTLGQAVFGAQIDEANFGQDKMDKRDEEKKSQVYDNYVSLLRRKESRFLHAAGHFCIGSSKRTHADFLEKHIESSRGKSGVLIIDAPQYVVKKCRGEYSGKLFRVLLGDITREPRILKDEEVVPEELKPYIEKVPVEFKRAYEDNIIEALRDISGKSAQPRSVLISNRELIRHSINVKRGAPWYFSAASKIPNTLNISFAGTDMIHDFLRKDILFSNNGKLPYDTRSRFLSIDTGYAGDAGGISMGCKGGARIITKDNRKLFIPKIFTDFVIRIKGQGKEHFPLYKFRDFVKFLVDDLHINIAGVSTDGFQSVQMRQEIQLAYPRMAVECLSVDATDEHYVSLRTIFYNEAIDIYEDRNLMVELFDLLHLSTGRRGTGGNMMQFVVDHPRVASDGNVGRKDVADSLAAMTALCRKYDTAITSEEVQQQVEDYKNIDVDTIMKDADTTIETALAEADKTLNQIFEKEEFTHGKPNRVR